MILDLSVWPSRGLAFFTTIGHSEPDVAFKLWFHDRLNLVFPCCQEDLLSMKLLTQPSRYATRTPMRCSLSSTLRFTHQMKRCRWSTIGGRLRTNAMRALLNWFLHGRCDTVLLWLLQFLISIILILPCIEIIERSMDVNEVTVNYRESGHGNDRRKLCRWVTRFHLNFPSMKSVLIVRQDVIDTMCMIIIIFVFLHLRHHFSEQCAQRAGLCQEQGCYPRVYWTMHQSTGFWSMVIWSRKTSFSGTARNSAFWWEDTNRRCLKLILHFEAAQRGVEGTRQILMNLVDGMNIAESSHIYVVDLLPNK